MTLTLDLEKIGTEETTKIEKKVPQSEETKPKPKGEIVRRILFISQEITLYPNGQMYLGKSVSWFKDKVYKQKKKKPKKVKVMDTLVGQTEEY